MPLQSKVIAFFVLLLGLIIGEGLFFGRAGAKIFREETSERASVLVRTLAQLSREPLVASQITRLEQLADSMLQEKDVRYARVYDAGTMVLAATDRAQEGWIFSGDVVAEPEIRFDRSGIVARAPVTIGDRVWGMAEIVVSLETMQAKISNLLGFSLGIFVIEFLLAAGFALFLEVQMLRPLDRLVQQVRGMAGDRSAVLPPPPPSAAREIARVTEALNETREQLIRAEAELISKTRLATMGQIAANLTHEIRNPLEAISGSVEILSTQTGLSRESRESLQIIQEEIRNLDDYLGEFLEFSRPGPLHPRPGCLNDAVSDSLMLLNPLFRKKRIRIGRELDPDLPVALFDANQIKRVLVNILLNSVEAVNEGGEIRIRSFARDGFIGVALTDDGAGIPRTALPRVFEPYFTTRKNGSGLGLALSRKIVEDHGGRIWADDGQETGTMIEFRIPGYRTGND